MLSDDYDDLEGLARINAKQKAARAEGNKVDNVLTDSGNAR